MHLDGAEVFRRFGINPVLLGCFLCLAGGVSTDTRAFEYPAAAVWGPIREFIHGAQGVIGPARDAVFAPGPRILARELRKRGTPRGIRC